MREIAAVSTAAMLFAALVGCSGTDGEGGEQCAGPEIRPHQSPMRFAEMYPPGETERPESAERSPYASTLLLENPCRQELEIRDSCLVGEVDDDEKNDADHFVKEGPTPSSFDSSTDGAARITYERSTPNEEDDVDNVAFVVQSNAENFPTLVVPICARVVGEGSERGVPQCESPVDIEGTKDRSLCSN